MRALTTEASARLARAMNPLRLSYTMFADANPWMAAVKVMAAEAAATRKPAAADNPLLAAQQRLSDQITAALDGYRRLRDDMAEQAFFGIYGSPLLQAMLGITAETEVRPVPDTTPAQRAAVRAERSAQAALLDAGGFDEALVRAVLYAAMADQSVDERSALALNVVRKELMHLSLAAFKTLVRDQFFVLQLEGDGAIAALAGIVPDSGARRDLLRQVETILSAGAPPTPAMRDRLARLVRMLPSLPQTLPQTPTGAGTPLPVRKPTRTKG